MGMCDDIICRVRICWNNFLTVPMGMPRDLRSSSDKSPGFFSFRRVSNSLPWEWGSERVMEGGEGRWGESEVRKGEVRGGGEGGWGEGRSEWGRWMRKWELLEFKVQPHPPHSTGLHEWTSLVLSATCRPYMVVTMRHKSETHAQTHSRKYRIGNHLPQSQCYQQYMYILEECIV